MRIELFYRANRNTPIYRSPFSLNIFLGGMALAGIFFDRIMDLFIFKVIVSLWYRNGLRRLLLSICLLFELIVLFLFYSFMPTMHMSILLSEVRQGISIIYLGSAIGFFCR